MSLKSVHENLAIIKDTSSTNAKISILSEFLQEDIFRLVIELMYDDSKHYKVNKLPPFSPPVGAFADKPLTSDLLCFMEQLSEQKVASNEDKRYLARLASIDQETYDVVKKIVNKDAKSGFGGKTINKAWEDLIFLMPYCRCSTEKSKMHKIDYENGAIGQEKADGMFGDIIIGKKGDVLFRTRNGNIVHQLDHLKEFLYKIPNKYRDAVYMGEFLICDNGIILPRKQGNGILSSCLQNTADQKMADKAIIKLWDVVPQKDFWAGHCKIKYKYRLVRTGTFIKDMSNIQPNTLLRPIKSKMLYSLWEAQDFYKKLRKEGKEGAIVKNQFAEWKDHTSPDQVKMKNVSDIELRIVGWKYGKPDTRFKDCMGSVQLKSDDDLIFVSVSGFTDEERLLDWDERIGKIASLEYDGLISDKSKPRVYSLYLPRNLEMRPDRSDTDTLKSVKNR